MNWMGPTRRARAGLLLLLVLAGASAAASSTMSATIVDSPDGRRPGDVVWAWMFNITVDGAWQGHTELRVVDGGVAVPHGVGVIGGLHGSVLKIQPETPWSPGTEYFVGVSPFVVTTGGSSGVGGTVDAGPPILFPSDFLASETFVAAQPADVPPVPGPPRMRASGVRPNPAAALPGVYACPMFANFTVDDMEDRVVVVSAVDGNQPALDGDWSGVKMAHQAQAWPNMTIGMGPGCLSPRTELRFGTLDRRGRFSGWTEPMRADVPTAGCACAQPRRDPVVIAVLVLAVLALRGARRHTGRGVGSEFHEVHRRRAPLPRWDPRQGVRGPGGAGF